jgi:hypothetical protein
MAAFSTYSDLQSTIASYLARTDLTAMIPAFIQLAETRLRRELRLRVMLRVATTNTVASDSTVQLPSDFLEMRDLHFNTDPTTVLKYNTPSIFYRNSHSTVGGRPVQYTVLANEFQLAPIPDSIYEMQMLYYAAPAFLSNTITTNVFLANCPDLLLYAALGEASPYLMDDARLQTWASLYERGVSALSTSDDQGEYGGSPLVITTALR